MGPSAGWALVFAVGVAFVLRAVVLAVLSAAVLLLVLSGGVLGLVGLAEIMAVALHGSHLTFHEHSLSSLLAFHTCPEKKDAKQGKIML